MCQILYTTVPDYVGRGVHDRLLKNDSIFRDGYANEMGIFSGSIVSGYMLTHTIVVNG
ncbi:hypothetical protein [Xanthocytophaga agilis]|uniref:hypothetical protein n=1 Tax=Xanthocytophaga agilis TaxID=3048010 RepID=UPI0028D8C1D6|nr:hypothetical protein [Xanthocytophaga agilis]